MQFRLRKFWSVTLSFLLLSQLFVGVAPAMAADGDIVVLSAGATTLDLSLSSEAIVVIDDGLTVSYDGALNMTLTVAVTGAGNVLGYDVNLLPDGMDVTFNYSPDSVVFEGTADAAAWQSLLRSVTLSIEPSSLPIYNEDRTVTVTTFANLEVYDYKTVNVITGAGADPGGGDTGGGDPGGGDPGGGDITPIITQQPVDLTVNAGEMANLSVTASVSVGELSYQWFRNVTGNLVYPPDWAAIENATGSTYTVPTQVAGTTYYYVDVINTAGDMTVTIFSDFVQVTVLAVTNAEAPTITTQPVGATVTAGQSASLSVTATGTGTLSYQWYSNATNSNSGGTMIEGATGATYAPPTAEASATYYYVVITNTDETATGNQTATATSDAVLVTVNALTNAAAPTITVQPAGATVNVGGSASLSVTATGTGTLSYQWYSNATNSNSGGIAIDGATSATYAAPTAEASATYYYVVITNTDETATGNQTATATSDAVLVTVNALTHAEAPTITTQPVGAMVNVGGSASLSVTATGTGTLSYQWYSNATNSNSDGTAIDSATGTTYAAPTTTAGETYYYVVITNTDETATGNQTATATSDAVLVTVNASGPIITTIAGIGSGGYSGDGGPAKEARLNNPYGVAIDASGNLYIADYTNHRIRKVAPDGTISTVAGTGSSGYSGDGGPADQARLNSPAGIAADSSGNLYIADRYNNRIRKVAPDGTISTVAGTGGAGYSGDGGPAAQAQINSPTGVTLDSSGNLYIADRYNNRIRKVAPDGTISTVAGTGSSGYSGDGGPADQAQLYWPFGVVLDSSGNLYITDYSNHRIRKVAPDGTISTVAGTDASGSAGDGGPAVQATLSSPAGIAMDGAGNLYVAVYGGSSVRKIALDGTISTVAGTGSSGYSGDGGPADEAQVNRPLGVAVDGNGNVYIADTFNHRIRQVALPAHAEALTITVQPVGATVNVGQSAILSVTATGTGTLSYQWYSNTTNSNSGGTLIAGANSATYAAPTATVGTTYYYVVVTNTDETATGNQTATATSDAVVVTVNAPPIIVQPSGNANLSSLSLSAGQLTPGFSPATISYTANVENAVTSVSVSASAAEAGATVAGTGTFDLSVGSNSITVVVTAPNGQTQSYSVNVIRAASNDASLSALSISAGTLTPGFAPTVTSYSVQVENDVTSVTVSGTPTHPGATVSVSGGANLQVGSNSITVSVTAQDGVTTSTYGLSVTRAQAAPPPAPAPASPPAPPTPSPVTSSPNHQVITAKVSTGTEMDENGRETQVTRVDATDLQSQLGQDSDKKAVVIPVNLSTGKATATLSVNATEQTASNNKENLIVVQSNEASYSLPANLVSKTSISNALGTSDQDASNAEVHVTIEEKPDTTVTRGKSKLVSKVLDFSITVSSGSSATELNNFGSTYVDRSIDLTSATNPSKSVGVVVNSDGTISPVPTEFVETDGKQVAVLKRNANSTYAVLENDVVLHDIAGHWGESTIQLLADKLIVNGFGDGSFRPNQQVTRAEFVALLVRALGLVTVQTENDPFKDVPPDAWYAGALAAAKEAGLVNGYPDGTFRADQSITRQDATVLLGNAITFLQLQGQRTQADADQALSHYSDKDQVAGYAQSAVGLASALGILQGPGDGTFHPLRTATRAETVVMMKRLMDLAGFITSE